jgi:hypothetical protein
MPTAPTLHTTMKPADLIDHSNLALTPVLRTAFIKTLEAWLPPMRHLPVPVRFRASGALRAWLAVFDALPDTGDARRALADPATSPESARGRLIVGLEAHIRISARDQEVTVPLVRTLLTLSSDLLAFWLRSGALYEPTLPLGGLLGGIDMSQELPMQLLQPPTRALCIVPPWQQQHQCANASAILLFTHDAASVQAPATTAFTFLVIRPSADGLMADQLTLPVKDENATLAATLARAAQATRQDPTSVELAGEDVDSLVAEWKVVLDYTVKVLLYLNLENAAVRAYQPHTVAPKEWPGLGRRKREAHLAEIEQLYDRYIIGPTSVAEWAGEHAGEVGAHGQLSAHWRRGHFRLQVHGPHSALRKVMFIMPTIVRADRLAEV